MENIKQNKYGFILVNKPIGPTSHDIVGSLRKITNIKKIGHSGTLDPFAEGLLILAINKKATQDIHKFVKLDKEYIAVLHLGQETDTYDNRGIIIQKYNILKDDIGIEKINEILNEFIGKQKQIPPMFSAKKINGKKLYNLARKGEVIERPHCDIEIFNLELLSYNFPEIKIKVHCSSGTYIRTLGFDIGRKLGCGAYLDKLTRTKIGKYKIEDAFVANEIKKDNWEKKLFYI